jgi:hypothetical protein
MVLALARVTPWSLKPRVEVVISSWESRLKPSRGKIPEERAAILGYENEGLISKALPERGPMYYDTDCIEARPSVNAIVGQGLAVI